MMILSCSENKNYVIEGTFENEKYDGEYVFLLPLDGVMPRIIDSVQVKDRSFVFTGKADSAQMKIIRMRHLLRLDIQELLVVVEPGNIWVRLDTVSAAGGTPQNEKLQAWKEVKMQSDETMNLLKRMWIRKPPGVSRNSGKKFRPTLKNTAFNSLKRTGELPWAALSAT
jgi:hypothetical protein